MANSNIPARARSANPRLLAWKQAVAKLRSAKAACAKIVIPRDRAIQDAAWERYYEAEEQLLALTAPDIEAVISKLMLIWEEDIPSSAPDAMHKRKLIGDLRRLKMRGEIK